MSIMSKRGIAGKNPYTRAESGFFSSLPQLHAVVVRNEGDFVGMSVKSRGEADWIVVLRRIGGDGEPQVAFGTTLLEPC